MMEYAKPQKGRILENLLRSRDQKQRPEAETGCVSSCRVPMWKRRWDTGVQQMAAILLIFLLNMGASLYSWS